MTFEAQNFLREKDTRLQYELLRLEDVAMCTAAVSYVELLIPKLYFEVKTPVFTPFFYRSTCFSVVEVLASFWTVPGQSGAKLPIFIYS